MKYLLSLLFFIPGYLFALDSEKIKQLAKEPHDRSNLIEELKIFPEARLYKATIKSKTPGKDPYTTEIQAKEKTVEGKYIVSETKFPDVDEPLIMVVTYDKENKIFKKWVLVPTGEVGSSTGVADLKNRSIAWVSDQTPLNTEHNFVALSIETHTDDKTTWYQTTLKDGKIVQRNEGTALKVK